jgi:tetratricopeptide (TPR) repeat protein
MVIVNEFQLKITLTKASNAAPVFLFLCKAAEREERARRFYGLPSYAMIERSYQKRLDELEAENQATEAARDRLRIERDQARTAARGAAEHLARLTIVKTDGKSEVSELHRELISNSHQSAVATTLNTLAYTYRRQNWTDEARKAYNDALKIRRELARQNPATYLPDVAETLNDLGNLLSDQNQIEEARRSFEEALVIRRALVTDNPRNYTFRPAVVIALNNLGNFLRQTKRMDEARKAFDEALGMCRQLTQLPVGDLPDIATMQKLLEDRESSYRELTKGLPVPNFFPDLAMTFRNIGILNIDQNRMEEARKAFNEALIIYETLAMRNPTQYGAEVETTRKLMNNLTNL